MARIWNTLNCDSDDVENEEQVPIFDISYKFTRGGMEVTTLIAEENICTHFVGTAVRLPALNARSTG